MISEKLENNHDASVLAGLPAIAYRETIESRVSGGNIPVQFMKAVRNGIRDGLQEGALAGYPVVDLHLDILDGAAQPRTQPTRRSGWQRSRPSAKRCEEPCRCSSSL